MFQFCSNCRYFLTLQKYNWIKNDRIKYSYIIYYPSSSVSFPFKRMLLISKFWTIIRAPLLVANFLSKQVYTRQFQHRYMSSASSKNSKHGEARFRLRPRHDTARAIFEINQEFSEDGCCVVYVITWPRAEQILDNNTVPLYAYCLNPCLRL